MLLRLTRNTRYASFLVTGPQHGSVSLYVTLPALQEWFPLRRTNTHSVMSEADALTLQGFPTHPLNSKFERSSQLQEAQSEDSAVALLLKVIAKPHHRRVTDRGSRKIIRLCPGYEESAVRAFRQSTPLLKSHSHLTFILAGRFAGFVPQRSDND